MLGGGTLLLGARSGPQDEQTAIVWGGVWSSTQGAHACKLLRAVLKGVRAPVDHQQIILRRLLCRCSRLFTLLVYGAVWKGRDASLRGRASEGGLGLRGLLTPGLAMRGLPFWTCSSSSASTSTSRTVTTEARLLVAARLLGCLGRVCRSAQVSDTMSKCRRCGVEMGTLGCKHAPLVPHQSEGLICYVNASQEVVRP
eukprot:1148765-Pelagomonas_calceolata.AAC.1